MSRGIKGLASGYAKDLSLTDKQEVFCREYIIRMSVEDAAKAASISIHTGYSWLKSAGCQSFIKSLMYERNLRTTIDADALKVHLEKMVLADFSDIMEGDDFKPIEEWPPIWRQMVNSRKVDKDGNVSYSFIDRAKTLEMLGKHADVGAWVEKVSLEIGLADGLAQARLRHKQKQQAMIERKVSGVVIDMKQQNQEAVGVSQEKPDQTH